LPHRVAHQARLLLVITTLVSLLATAPVAAQTSDGNDAVNARGGPELDIFFPVHGDTVVRDTWGAARSNGRTHEGVDLGARQMTPVYAAQAGRITAAKGETCAVGQVCQDYYLAIAGDDGRGYFYVHLNDDTPGRPDGCDGLGGVRGAFAPRLVTELEARGTLRNVRVQRGEHIGYVGSSGNASCSGPHLHFEIWNDTNWGRDAGKANPFNATRAAYEGGRRHVGPATGVGTPAVPAGRIAGPARVETAVELSRASLSSAQTAVLVPAGSPAEALVAAPLAVQRGAAMLLTWAADGGRTLEPAVLGELARLRVRDVVLVGTRAQLPDALVATLEAASIRSVTRLTGADRMAVAAAVADEVLRAAPTPVAPLLALGSWPDPAAQRDWPDALAASGVAAVQGAPVLLTDPGALPPETLAVLARHADRISAVRIVGGEASITSGVARQLGSANVPHRRIAGINRFATAVAVAGELTTHRAGPRVLLATGMNYPDALAAGPAAARLDAVVLLTGPTLAPETAAWLPGRKVTRVDGVGAVGVLPAATLRIAAERAASG
jgi:putative cell wall-binding protein